MPKTKTPPDTQPTAAPTEERMVFGEVYAPNRPDSVGDFMTAEEIRLMAYNFMKNLRQQYLDINHDNRAAEDVTIVESFIAREGDPMFIPGSWVVGVHVNNDKVWADIKAGKLNGFSIEASGHGKDVEVELNIPPVLSGDTDVVNGHSHKFYVGYDQEGNFIGGKTSLDSGHFHTIRAGTFTDSVDGHTHRFSAVDDIFITS